MKLFRRSREIDEQKTAQTTTSAATPPVEQLEFVHREVERQLGENLAVQANVITRATVLVAASGLLGASVSNEVANTWQLASIALALVAACCGLCSLWLWKSEGAEITASTRDSYLAASPDHVQWAIVEDLLQTLAARRADLKKKARWVSAGFLILVVSWLLSMGASILVPPSTQGGEMNDSKPTPVVSTPPWSTDEVIALPSMVGSTLTASQDPADFKTH
ncbi:hypothetical protein [Rathayibacter sp. Leaf248]|uniref:hypothetical protein n=1 Tax=Rathayibacter sp. Leaf248 TaxID=2876555 RepID=UPI001E51C773|nr:hypothetical protein [Rathayibacter sp. Leaf248]